MNKCTFYLKCWSVFIVLLFGTAQVGVGQSTLFMGDIAFIGWNSDGDDDIVFIVFADIQEGTIIYFNDNEYNDGWTTGEGVLSWTAPSGGINSGSVIQIFDCAVTSTTVSEGLITRTSGSFNISISEEAVYAYQSDESWDTGNFTFLAAFCNAAIYDTLLNGTGLTDEVDSWSWGDKDNWKYIGPASSSTTEEMKTNLQNSGNWEYSDGSGDQSFTFSYASDMSLPVELTTLTAECVGGAVVITWATASETDNLGFIIYRKNGWIDFSPLVDYRTNQQLAGQGSTTRQTDYSYTDRNVNIGQTYSYLLADVNYEGLETQYSPIQVKVEAPPLQVNTPHPNPFNPTTRIAFMVGQPGLVTVSIYDIQGRLVNQLVNDHLAIGNYSITWDGLNARQQAVASGIYFLQVSAPAGRYCQKLVLAR